MFDENLILKDGSVALDESDSAAVSETINSDGNLVLDIKFLKTILFTTIPYSDE